MIEKYNMDFLYKAGLSSAATFLSWLFGEWDIALQALVLFLLFDYITGFIRATVNHELSSDVGFKGISRKVTILIVLSVSVILDRLINNEIWLFRTLVSYFYISNEGVSLIENCAALGLPIPEKIKVALKQLSDGKKSSNKKEE